MCCCCCKRNRTTGSIVTIYGRSVSDYDLLYKIYLAEGYKPIDRDYKSSEDFYNRERILNNWAYRKWGI